MTRRSSNILWTLVTVLAATLFLGGMIVVRRTDQVEDSRRECVASGFLITAGFTGPSWLRQPQVTPYLDAWLSRSSVQAMRSRVTDEDWMTALPSVQRLPDVVHISFHTSKPSEISSRTLETLSEFPRLESLDLGGSPISDQDLTAIADLKNLKSLALDNTPVTGIGLGALEQMSQLEHLSLDGTLVWEEGVRAIGRLKSLKSLSLSNTGLPESVIMDLEKQIPGVMISDD